MHIELPAIEGLRLRGSGVARPSDVSPEHAVGRLTNAQVYEQLLGSDWKTALQERGFSWVLPRNGWGIAGREWAGLEVRDRAPACDALDLAEAAARAACEAAGWDPHSVESIHACTLSLARDGAEREPLARTLAERLGASSASAPAIACDATGGLATWVEALHAAREAGDARPRRLLVVGADTLSGAVTPERVEAALALGDLGAALAIEWTDEPAGGIDGAGTGALEGTDDLPTDARLWLDPDPALSERHDRAWTQAIEGIVHRPSAAQFLPFGVTAEQLGRTAERAGYKATRLKSALAEHACTGAATVLASVHQLLVDSEKAGADLSVVNLDLVGASPDGRWAWMRWNLGDDWAGTGEPEESRIP